MEQEQVKRDEFEEVSTNAIFALNSLMQCAEVGKRDKALVKINRFKQWLLELTDKVGAEKQQMKLKF